MRGPICGVVQNVGKAYRRRGGNTDVFVVGCGHDICSAFDNWSWCLGSIHCREICRTFSGKFLKLCTESCLAHDISKLDPYRCLQILHLPIKAMRVVTDPVVDSTIFLVTHAILPTILRIARRQVQTCYTCIMFFVRHLVGATITDKFTHAIHSAVSTHFYRIQT